MEVRTQALAKLNIFLFVGSKRTDGYHNLVSLMQKTDLFSDDITLCYKESEKTSVHVFGLENFVSEKDSSIYKACMLWLKKTSHKAEISVNVEKGIPVNSGLGGESSDAASVILALERCTGNKTKFSTLVEIALEVGSDVPFFVYDCDAAVVSGRGDIVHPIEARTDIEFEVFPGPQPKQSTSRAFDLLDSIKTVNELPSGQDLVYAYRENPKFWVNTNDFEILYEKPCKDAFLTGSGNYWFTVSICK